MTEQSILIKMNEYIKSSTGLSFNVIKMNEYIQYPAA
jgi:hypothetical protein